MSRDLQNICSRTKKKTRDEILKFESKKMRVELKKKNTRVEKERTLTSCVVYRCLHPLLATHFRNLIICHNLCVVLFLVRYSDNHVGHSFGVGGNIFKTEISLKNGQQALKAGLQQEPITLLKGKSGKIRYQLFLHKEIAVAPGSGSKPQVTGQWPFHTKV